MTCSRAWAALTGTYQGLEARPTSPVMGTFRTRAWSELLRPLAIGTLRESLSVGSMYRMVARIRSAISSSGSQFPS